MVQHPTSQILEEGVVQHVNLQVLEEKVHWMHQGEMEEEIQLVKEAIEVAFQLERVTEKMMPQHHLSWEMKTPACKAL